MDLCHHIVIGRVCSSLVILSSSVHGIVLHNPLVHRSSGIVQRILPSGLGLLCYCLEGIGRCAQLLVIVVPDLDETGRGISVLLKGLALCLRSLIDITYKLDCSEIGQAPPGVAIIGRSERGVVDLQQRVASSEDTKVGLRLLDRSRSENRLGIDRRDEDLVLRSQVGLLEVVIFDLVGIHLPEFGFGERHVGER